MKVLNKYEEISLDDLMVNPANDRHGELEDEMEAMNWLLSDSKAKIKTLAKDIAEKGYVFTAPLISKVDDIWLLHDGNRRVTCVKMLHNPTLANDVTWQRFFDKLSKEHKGNIPTNLMCRIEEDDETINDIVYRLHAGGESGVGTVDWKPHQKQNHAIRNGKQSVPSLGMQIEAFLREKGLISGAQKLPIRNIEKLLSSQKYHEQVGIEYKKGESMSFIYPEDKVLKMLKKVCDDFLSREIAIDSLIRNKQKDEYFERLAKKGFTLKKSTQLDKKKKTSQPKPKKKPKRKPLTKPRYCLIPADTEFECGDSEDLQRIKAIIDELKTLPLKTYINAISVLFRVLLESCTNHYNAVHNIHPRSDKIHVSVKAALEHMVEAGDVFGKDAETLNKFAQKEEIISANTFHAYVHSHTTHPREKDLCAMWDSFYRYIQNCIAADKQEKAEKKAA